ncbi:MAG: OmpH family outer membrane protein [Deltaproteobacteria bacterium]|nr:OmpH family outer membrane protein [Deltaproteobacteria bacterium]
MRLQFSALLLVLSVVFASNVALAAETIGYVDLQRALNEVDEGAAARSRLKKEFEAKQKSLDSQQNELKAMKEEIDARGMMMKPEAKQAKMQELQRKLMEVQQLYYSLQKELSEKEAKVTQGIFQKMGTLLQTMGRDAGYTMIVEKSAVLYAKNHIDLTNELIRRYNEAYSPKKKKGKKGK